MLPEIPEHSNANCFVLSELSLIRNPLSFVTIAVDVTEAKPAIVVAVLPSARPVLPIVTELLARLLFAIEVDVVKTVPVSFGNVIVLSAVGSVTVNVVS